MDECHGDWATAHLCEAGDGHCHTGFNWLHRVGGTWTVAGIGLDDCLADATDQGVPADVARQFSMVDDEDCAAKPTTTSEPGNSADPSDPAGYEEGVVSAANPYGCDFTVIEAENPCAFKWADEGESVGPQTPAQRWSACVQLARPEFCD